jgi:hypothetical protein
MNANDCYKCKRNLCELVLDCNGDGELNVPYEVLVDGTYKLVMRFKNKRIIFTSELELGEQYRFEVEELNENYCYTFHIENEMGDILDFDDYNYFSICTNQEY